MSSSWTPNENAQTLFAERCWLQGVMVSSVAYGISVSLYVMSFHLLVRNSTRVEFKKRLPLLIYITVAFILGTIFMVTLAAFTQMAFIDNRDYPGGPNAYENNMFSIPVDDVGNASFVLTNWLADALVVWRCKVIYQGCRVPIWIVMLLPCLMLAASIAMGIMFLIQVSTTNPYVTSNINFTLPYLSISLALNIIVTIAIVLRLLTLRYRIVSVLGATYGTQYTSIAAMIIESAALYSVLSVAFLVLFGIGNAVSEVFLQSLSQFQIIATLLIAFRVAQGKGWSEDTVTRVMNTQQPESLPLHKMRFALPGASETLASSGDTTDSKIEEACGMNPSSRDILVNVEVAME
ncbi:hypothetical protein HYDPIDRAFT_89869 [Hydnomerulius pinastri MD-312]|uniref:Uncharacterized protein n=1 Tax=Hydnomerulius pinastri MD-312 TaxID=994086 RepID=A0A0C9WG73_9AGAM|nr:hypothetical protein HYDPIDRAFT_89869 [Hydnomerulius pinastri MD-312]